MSVDEREVVAQAVLAEMPGESPVDSYTNTKKYIIKLRIEKEYLVHLMYNDVSSRSADSGGF